MWIYTSCRGAVDAASPFERGQRLSRAPRELLHNSRCDLLNNLCHLACVKALCAPLSIENPKKRIVREVKEYSFDRLLALNLSAFEHDRLWSTRSFKIPRQSDQIVRHSFFAVALLEMSVHGRIETQQRLATVRAWKDAVIFILLRFVAV